jgi:hypothetical protein
MDIGIGKIPSYGGNFDFGLNSVINAFGLNDDNFD